MFKIVAFGEVLIRIPFNINGFESSHLYWGGAECNSLCSLSKWGNKAKLVTKLPNNKITDLALDHFKHYQVDTSSVIIGGNRIGTYYYMAPKGYIAGEVVYDRSFSSINSINDDVLDKEEIFKDADVFFVTGITLALGCREKLIELWDYAKSKGVKLVFDVNYRSTLWSLEEAKKYMGKFLEESDILFASPFDIKEFLAVEAETEEQLYKKVYNDYNKFAIARLWRRQADNINYHISAMLCYEGKFIETNTYTTTISERIGGGDSFVSGILQGLLNNEKDPLNFALMGVLMKYQIKGDILNINPKDIREALKNINLDVKR